MEVRVPSGAFELRGVYRDPNQLQLSTGYGISLSQYPGSSQE